MGNWRVCCLSCVWIALREIAYHLDTRWLTGDFAAKNPYRCMRSSPGSRPTPHFRHPKPASYARCRPRRDASNLSMARDPDTYDQRQVCRERSPVRDLPAGFAARITQQLQAWRFSSRRRLFWRSGSVHVANAAWTASAGSRRSTRPPAACPAIRPLIASASRPAWRSHRPVLGLPDVAIKAPDLPNMIVERTFETVSIPRGSESLSPPGSVVRGPNPDPPFHSVLHPVPI